MAPPGGRRRFPSDHRSWFRVTEDILDEHKLNGADWILGAYMRVLAMLNRTGSRDGILRVSYPILGALMNRRRGDIALKRLALGVHLGLYSAARYADFVLILVPKWPIIQGFAPTPLQRNPGSKSKSKSKSKNKKELEPDGSHERLMNLISREPGTPSEKAAWLDREFPLLAEFAERDYPDDPKKQSAEIRTRVIRHYRQYLKSGGQPAGSEAKAMAAATRRSQDEVDRTRRERDAAYQAMEEER